MKKITYKMYKELLDQHGEERALLNEALEIIKFYSKKNVQVCKYIGKTQSGRGSLYKIIDRGNKARNFQLKIKRMSKKIGKGEK